MKNNKFAQTLANEAAQQAAKEAAALAKTEKEAAEAAAKEAEKKYDDVENYDLVTATQALSKKEGRYPVEIAGVITDYATNEEAAEALRVDLHHYGKNLVTPEAVNAALLKRNAIITKARELLGADFVPETSYEVDGCLFLIKDKKAYTLNGNLYADLNEYSDGDLANAKVKEELFTKRIREKLATVKAPKVEEVATPKVTDKEGHCKIVITVTTEQCTRTCPCYLAVGESLIGKATLEDIVRHIVDRQPFYSLGRLAKDDLVNKIIKAVDRSWEAKDYYDLYRKMTMALYNNRVRPCNAVELTSNADFKLWNYITENILNNSLITVY